MFDVNGLTQALLKENFRYWVKILADERDTDDADLPCTTFLSSIPTTHTWGYRHPQRNRERRYLFERILFDDEALLSKAERIRIGEPPPKTVGDNARAAGLEQFVFAYLGVHEPHYARGEFPAFGVFIRKSNSLERFPMCNVSRRDLDSPEIRDRDEPLERHFLFPAHGRELAEMECALDKRHGGDPWVYWSTYKHWTQDSWMWKVEFHYRGRVPVSEFAAILWPRQRGVLTLEKGDKADTRRNRGAQRFQDLHPECAVVMYPWHRESYAKSLVRASSLAANHYSQHGTFGCEIMDNWEIMSCGC